MIATLRLSTFARMGFLDSATDGLDERKARRREVMNASGDEWKENVSDKLEKSDEEPLGNSGSCGVEVIFS